MRRTLVLVIVLVGVAALAWAADNPTPAGTPEATPTGSAASASPSPAESVAPTLPPCAHAAAPVAIPPEFPKNIQFPPGTITTSTRRAGAALVLEGLVPMELPQATRFFLQKLAAAGYRLGRGEAEEGEAEDRFFGNGIQGFFRLRTMRDCPGALQLVITVSEYKPPPSASPR
jgi:hypothetical protein